MASTVEKEPISCLNDPNYAVVCIFLQKFGHLLEMDLPNTGKLQQMIEDTEEVADELKDLHVKLLRKTKKSVAPDKWERALVKFCHTYSTQDAWEVERIGYKKLNLPVKLRILKELLEQQFDKNAKFKNAVNLINSKVLRSEPIGKDKLGNAYWSTIDSDCNVRIYQEHLDEEIWKIVATNRDEIVRLINCLKGNELVMPSLVGLVDEDSSSNSCPMAVKIDALENGNKESGEPDSAMSESLQTEAEHTTNELGNNKNEIGEAIEEPVMYITGSGNGNDCNAMSNSLLDDLEFEVSETIEEDIQYVFGFGSGADCDVGNPQDTEKRDPPVASFFFGQPGCLKLSPMKNILADAKSADTKNEANTSTSIFSINNSGTCSNTQLVASTSSENSSDVNTSKIEKANDTISSSIPNESKILEESEEQPKVTDDLPISDDEDDTTMKSTKETESNANEVVCEQTKSGLGMLNMYYNDESSSNNCSNITGTDDRSTSENVDSNLDTPKVTKQLNSECLSDNAVSDVMKDQSNSMENSNETESKNREVNQTESENVCEIQESLKMMANNKEKNESDENLQTEQDSKSCSGDNTIKDDTISNEKMLSPSPPETQMDLGMESISSTEELFGSNSNSNVVTYEKEVDSVATKIESKVELRTEIISPSISSKTMEIETFTEPSMEEQSTVDNEAQDVNSVSEDLPVNVAIDSVDSSIINDKLSKELLVNEEIPNESQEVLLPVNEYSEKVESVSVQKIELVCLKSPVHDTKVDCHITENGPIFNTTDVLIPKASDISIENSLNTQLDVVADEKIDDSICAMDLDSRSNSNEEDQIENSEIGPVQLTKCSPSPMEIDENVNENIEKSLEPTLSTEVVESTSESNIDKVLSFNINEDDQIIVGNKIESDNVHCVYSEAQLLESQSGNFDERHYDTENVISSVAGENEKHAIEFEGNIKSEVKPAASSNNLCLPTESNISDEAQEATIAAETVPNLQQENLIESVNDQQLSDISEVKNEDFVDDDVDNQSKAEIVESTSEPNIEQSSFNINENDQFIVDNKVESDIVHCVYSKVQLLESQSGGLDERHHVLENVITSVAGENEKHAIEFERNIKSEEKPAASSNNLCLPTESNISDEAQEATIAAETVIDLQQESINDQQVADNSEVKNEDFVDDGVDNESMASSGGNDFTPISPETFSSSENINEDHNNEEEIMNEFLPIPTESQFVKEEVDIDSVKVECESNNAQSTSEPTSEIVNLPEIGDVKEEKNIEVKSIIETNTEATKALETVNPVIEEIPVEIPERKKESKSSTLNLSFDYDGSEPANVSDIKQLLSSAGAIANKTRGKADKRSENITPEKTPPSGRKRGGRKARGMDVDTSLIIGESSESAPPVRQSRRIAQLKIKEEAERRQMEEIALKKLKEESEKKKKPMKEEEEEKMESADDDDEDDDYSDGEDKKRKKKRGKEKKKGNKDRPWQSTSENESSDDKEDEFANFGIRGESEDERLPVVVKSDHEFSPESDLEDETQAAPLKRARTAKKETKSDTDAESDDGFPDHACQKCSKSDHPEWILLCDKCDKGYHCSCLSPVLFVIPEGDWFCPPCQHEMLIDNLQNHLGVLDEMLKQKEIEENRLKRMSYTNVTVANVIDDDRVRKTCVDDVKSNKLNELISEEESNSSEATDSDDSDAPIYKLRRRKRAVVSYRFNDYDDMIDSAIKRDMGEVKGAGNLGRGKDISTIIEAESGGRNLNASWTKSDSESSLDDDDVEKSKGTNKKRRISNSDSEPFAPKNRSISKKKKARKLNSLDSTSSDDDESDEDFKTSSISEDEEEEAENFSASSGSDGSFELEISRKRNKKGLSRKCRPVRSRKKRFEAAFINDNSDDDSDNEPLIKKRKIKEDSDFDEFDDDISDDEEELEDLDSEDLCDDTETDSGSDGGWGRKKKKSAKKAASKPSFPRPPVAKKKVKKLEDDERAFRVGKVKLNPSLDSDDEAGSSTKGRRTRGKKLTYIMDEFDSSDDGIKPGVRRPDTPPEEREQFIKKQEEIKRMLVEKNLAAAKALAVPKMDIIPELPRDRESPTAILPPVPISTESDNLSTIPLQIIQTAKALDYDYNPKIQNKDIISPSPELPANLLLEDKLPEPILEHNTVVVQKPIVEPKKRSRKPKAVAQSIPEKKLHENVPVITQVQSHTHPSGIIRHTSPGVILPIKPAGQSVISHGSSVDPIQPHLVGSQLEPPVISRPPVLMTASEAASPSIPHTLRLPTIGGELMANPFIHSNPPKTQTVISPSLPIPTPVINQPQEVETKKRTRRKKVTPVKEKPVEAAPVTSAAERGPNTMLAERLSMPLQDTRAPPNLTMTGSSQLYTSRPASGTPTASVITRLPQQVLHQRASVPPHYITQSGLPPGPPRFYASTQPNQASLASSIRSSPFQSSAHSSPALTSAMSMNGQPYGLHTAADLHGRPGAGVPQSLYRFGIRPSPGSGIYGNHPSLNYVRGPSQMTRMLQSLDPRHPSQEYSVSYPGGPFSSFYAPSQLLPPSTSIPTQPPNTRGLPPASTFQQFDNIRNTPPPNATDSLAAIYQPNTATDDDHGPSTNEGPPAGGSTSEFSGLDETFSNIILTLGSSNLIDSPTMINDCLGVDNEDDDYGLDFLFNV